MRNEASGVRSEDIQKCANIMSQLDESIRGDKSFEEAWKDELYRSVFRLMIKSVKRNSDHEIKKAAYSRVGDMGELVQVLYDRMTTYYNRTCVVGAELPGISWSMESNGVFVITLKECAINMEHTLANEDESELAQRGIVFNVWLDVPDMGEDEDEESFSPDRNCCKYVGFTCDFGGEYKDVVFKPIDCNHEHLELVRNILADFDVIDEMAGKKKSRGIKEGGQYHEEL